MRAHALRDGLTLAILVTAYVGLGLGRLPGLRVDRTGVAIIGAAAMVVGGLLSWDDAIRSVDAHTLVLLFGMMIVAAYLRLSGFFSLVTLWAIRRAHGPRSLLAAVIAASGLLSALFVNNVICLVLAPLLLTVTRRLRLPPLPYLIALATAANVGSVATLTGNPQNMLVGSFSSISCRGFLIRQSPVALLGRQRVSSSTICICRAIRAPHSQSTQTTGASTPVSSSPHGRWSRSVSRVTARDRSVRGGVREGDAADRARARTGSTGLSRSASKPAS